MPAVLSKFARFLTVSKESTRAEYMRYHFDRGLTLRQKIKEINLYDCHPLSPWNPENRVDWEREYDHPSPYSSSVY